MGRVWGWKTSRSKQDGFLRRGELIDGRYRVVGPLGEGGMGYVVLAKREHDGQRVAIKLLRSEMAGVKEQQLRFEREARAACEIDSEHVTRVLDLGVHEGAPYIVFEYLQGQDLGNLLRSQRQPSVLLSVELVLQATRGVSQAHALGIVHRDLKPANLFVTSRAGQPWIKILDFGISKLDAAPHQHGLTATEMARRKSELQKALRRCADAGGRKVSGRG